MTGIGWVVVAVFRLWSAVSSGSVSTSGNLWAHKAISDNQVVSCLSSKVYYGVTHPITCMVTCPQNSTCDAFFYSESEAKCVTCPYPCQQVSLVTASGFRYYKQQRTPQCPTQKGYYHYDDTGVCLKVYTQDKTQQDALLSCQLDGGHLFDINTEEEFNNLKDYFVNIINAASLGSNVYYWLGASDEAAEDEWFWTDCTSAKDMLTGKFDPSQPNGGTGQNGLVIRGADCLLHDRLYSYEAFYVCEIDPS